MNTHEQTFRDALLAMLPRLKRYCYALTNNAHDADDLLQASVEKALSRWQQYQPGSHFDRWMYRLVRNHWIDTMRSHIATDELQEEQLPPDESSATEQRVASAQLLARARQHMGNLSEGLRMVLYLVAVEGRSYQETADILDIPPGTVMSRLARARAQLSDALTNGNPGEVSA